MATSAATIRDTRSESHNRAWVMLLGVVSVAAAALLMFIGASLGALYAVVAVLGMLAVILVLVAPVFGVVAFVGTLLLGLPWFLAGDGRLTANNLLGLILLAVLIVQVCLSRDLWFVKTPQMLLLGLIGFVLLGSFMHARQMYIPHVPLPKDFAENTMFLFFTRLLFLCMFVNFVRSRRHVLLVLFSVLVFTMTVIPSAFYNLANYKGEEDIATGKTFDEEGKVTEFRITSDTTSWGRNENRFAFMCNVSILLVWMFLQLWRRPIVWVTGFGLILTLAGLTITTASRSGFLSLGLVFGFLLLQKGVSAAFRLGVIVAALFCGIVVLTVLPRASVERLMNYSLDQSAHPEAWRSTQRRIETNEHALAMFRSAPLLGVGPGNFRWLHRELFPDSVAAGAPNHNSYLWAATEGGVFTLLLYGILFVVLWREFGRAQRLYVPSDPLWHVTRFLRGFLLIYLFFSAFADFWLEPHLYIMAGLAMLLVRRFPAQGAGEPAAASVRGAVPAPAH